MHELLGNPPRSCVGWRTVHAFFTLSAVLQGSHDGAIFGPRGRMIGLLSWMRVSFYLVVGVVVLRTLRLRHGQRTVFQSVHQLTTLEMEGVKGTEINNSQLVVFRPC